MHGGDLYDRVVNLGGLVGRASILSGKKEVKVNHAKDLVSTISQYGGDIIGLSLFAHGGQDGTIQMPGFYKGKDKKGNPIYDFTRETHQSFVLAAVDQNGFKLSQAYLMQCYSGFKGTYLGHQYDWASAWRSRVFGTLKIYQGLNVGGVDTE